MSALAKRLTEPAPPSLAQRIHATLRSEILSGTLPPGTRLNETVLASELSASRTPVREALRQLAQEGLAEPSAAGGLEVMALTTERVGEIMGIRSVLEAYAAELAAERISHAELDRLRAAHQRAAHAIDAGDLELLVHANTDFHDGVTAASQARRCIAIISELRDWVLRYRPLALADDASRRRSFAQHAAILRALENHDPCEASALTRQHIIDSTLPVIESLADR
jgi:DNA-binding GntR family transcriptional regulator